MRKSVSVIAAAALFASSTAALAADPQNVPPASSDSSQPLAPGGAAGVHNAQLMNVPAAFWIGGAIVVGAGLAVVLTQDNHNHTASATNTTPTVK